MGRPQCVWMRVPHARGRQRASSNKKHLNNGEDWVMCPGGTLASLYVQLELGWKCVTLKGTAAWQTWRPGKGPSARAPSR